MSNSQSEISNQKFCPYIPPEQRIKEFSIRAIILGIILAVVFGAANAYVGLKVGMTVSASIPAAVISMAVLRGFFKNGTVLENNMVQAIGSSGESLAAGVIFTIPALIFLGFSPSILEIFILSAVGGFLGILFMIPLRNYLIVREHGKLPYPEGTACAQILIAGEMGGAKALTVFLGLTIGGVYKFLMKGFGLWKDEVFTSIKLNNQPQVQTLISAETSPVLLGVGYIIGPRIAALMFAGAFLGWLVLIPVIQYIGTGFTSPIPPANQPISQLDPVGLWKNYIRYIGAGAVLLGGVVSLLKALPIIIKSIKHSIKPATQQSSATARLRTEIDIPMKWVLIISVLVIAITFAYIILTKGGPDINPWSMGIVSIILILVFGTIFITVASQIVGIVGSSSSPVSGMTITTLIATALVIVALGWTGFNGKILAMTIGAIVCIAVCMAGDISQDLKTGFLVGSTPYKLQIAEFIGVLAPAIVIAGVLLLLQNTYGFGEGKELKAPQATLMAMIVNGIFGGHLPWILIIIGVFIGIVVELLGISSLPFAIGLYLPFSLSAPIMIGGAVAWAVGLLSKQKENPPDQLNRAGEKGILFASGLVAGDALMGIIIALLASITINSKTIADWITIRSQIPDNGWEHLLGFGIFIALSLIFILVVRTKKNTHI